MAKRLGKTASKQNPDAESSIYQRGRRCRGRPTVSWKEQTKNLIRDDDDECLLHSSY